MITRKSESVPELTYFLINIVSIPKGKCHFKNFDTSFLGFFEDKIYGSCCGGSIPIVLDSFDIICEIVFNNHYIFFKVVCQYFGVMLVAINAPRSRVSDVYGNQASSFSKLKTSCMPRQCLSSHSLLLIDNKLG